MTTLANTIAAINESTDPTLGMSSDEAVLIKNAIADLDPDDAAAWSAYDLLHNRAVHGRAF